MVVMWNVLPESEKQYYRKTPMPPLVRKKVVQTSHVSICIQYSGTIIQAIPCRVIPRILPSTSDYRIFLQKDPKRFIR